MGTFRITVEIADPRGQHFEAVEMLVDTGVTKAPRDLLEQLGVPVESTYTALADGSRVERTRGRRVEGKEFPTPGSTGNRTSAMALEEAGSGPAPKNPGRRPGNDQRGNMNEGAPSTR